MELIQYNWCPYRKSISAQRDDHMKRHQEGGHMQAKERSLTENQPFLHLDLGLPASRAMRK